MPATHLVVALFTLLAPPPQSTQPATMPGLPASQRASVRDVRQLDIYRKLLRERDAAQPLLPTHDPSENENDAQTTAGGLLLEGTMLVQKSGRLVREAERSLFEFDALGIRNAPSSFELVRNALLETAENAAERGGNQFIITAEVTRYRGRNLLILKQVNIRPPSRNLSH